MFQHRFILVFCALLLLTGLPTGYASATPVLATVSSSLSSQADKPVETISAGGSHTCWLKSDNTIVCWGINYNNQATPPAGTFTQVSAGYLHSCGLKSDGSIVCWGAGVTNPGTWPDYGQASPPEGTFTQISAGITHTCGLQSDNTITCWGDNHDGQTTSPVGTFKQVSAGGYNTCGIKSDNTVICWGATYWGQSTPPTGTFTQISAGDTHVCGLRSNGTLACWGHNDYGESTPPTGAFKQITAGGNHTCGIKSAGTLACWGRNDAGEELDKIPTKTFTQIDAGDFHTCGLQSDGALTCWGNGLQARPFAISGNAGEKDVVLSYTDGSAKTVTTGYDGSYSIYVSYNWSGTVTPSKTWVNFFTPASRSYATLTASQTKQDYTPTRITKTISGNTGSSGTFFEYTIGSNRYIANTDDNGNYSIRVPLHWSGTITPMQGVTYQGETIVPASRSYTDVTSDQTAQNYTLVYTVTSSGAQDGWILESKETSNSGGRLNASANTLRLGDDGADRQYKVILSFDASVLEMATVKSAVLKIKQSGPPIGKNPFNSLGKLGVDIRQFEFGNSPALQLRDFSAAASAVKVGAFNTRPVNGWYSVILNAAGRRNIGKSGGLTQLRLYFAMDDNDNRAANIMSFLSGNNATDKPVLIITFSDILP